MKLYTFTEKELNRILKTVYDVGFADGSDYQYEKQNSGKHTPHSNKELEFEVKDETGHIINITFLKPNTYVKL